MFCPCGSNLHSNQCCERFINLAANKRVILPTTAEQLMRSRYCAYTLNNAEYIYQTYAKASQKQQSIADIEEWAKQCKWVKLTVYSQTNSSGNECSDDYDYVEFSAFYIQQDTLYEMREKSRFIQELNDDNQLAWRYLDGDIIKHQALTQIKRNDPCPCYQLNDNNSQQKSKKIKKYKHCCGR